MTHEPTFITPPTGTYRVLAFTGAKVEKLAERPETEEGRTAALTLFNSARFPAAFCHGPTVVKRNNRGESHSAAFRAFLADAPASTPAPRRVVVEEPADPRELARAAANHPVSPERSPAPRPVAEAPAVTPRPVEPPAAPAALPKPVEEPMPAKPTEKLCTNCRARPPATVTKRTRAGHAEWCGKCRKTHWKPAGEATAAPSKKARAPKPAARKVAASAPKTPAPSKRAATPVAGVLDESLALVESHATLIRRLGGVEAATRLAVLVEAHGVDAVAHAVERVLAIGGAS